MSLRRILGLGLLGIMLAKPLMYSAPQGGHQRSGKRKGGSKNGGGGRSPTGAAAAAHKRQSAARSAAGGAPARQASFCKATSTAA
jgi:hypothetical protein